MSSRRPMGALEDHVMEYLWAVDAPATPREVHQAVAPELAYTTVTTVLTRLAAKGRVGPSPPGPVLRLRARAVRGRPSGRRHAHQPR